MVRIEEREKKEEKKKKRAKIARILQASSYFLCHFISITPYINI
jgi:hypothetical protein